MKIPGVGLPVQKAINPLKWSFGVSSTRSSGSSHVHFLVLYTPNWKIRLFLWIFNTARVKGHEIHGTFWKSLCITFESLVVRSGKKRVQPWSLQFIMVKTSCFHFLDNCLSPLLSLYGHSGLAELCIARPLFLMERKSRFSWAAGNPYRFTRV